MIAKTGLRDFLLPPACLVAPSPALAALAAWRLVLLCTVFAVTVGIVISFVMTPVYRAEGHALPATEDVAAKRAMGGVADLADLAGINLGSDSASQEQLEILESQKFLADFIIERHKLPEIYPESWDAAAGKWKAGVIPPTMGHALKRVRDGMLAISQDRKTGVITVTFRDRSPAVAAEWVNDYFADANRKIRDSDVARIERMVAYLNAQAVKPNQPVEVRQAIYRLVEEQLKSLAMAMSDREYAFRVFDPARVPEALERVAPVRTSIALISLVAGMLFGIGIAAAANAYSRRHDAA